jgi:signal transduction histidine kinase/ActR/RegA family two-component response regulator
MDNGTLEAKLRGAPIGFAVLEGPSLIFTAANARYLEMVSRSDIVGRAWVDVFPELVGTPAHAAVASAYAGQRIEVDEFPISLQRANAVQECFYSFVLDPTRSADGSITGFIVIALEVTELVARRRQAESLASSLRRSEARYRALFGALDDGFCLLQMIFDERGEPIDYRFLEVNDAFLRHTGLPHPVGRTARELVPELDESWFRLYGRVAKTGEPARFENKAPAMDGRWFDVFASRVGEPELCQVGLVFKDVSAKREAELEREALLAAEQAARKEAETANRLKDEFLAAVSHELRTPLNAVLGWTALLRTGRLDPARAAHALETIERNARAQAQLVEDLLDVSRILEGKLRLQVEPTDLRATVQAAIDAVRPAAAAKNVHLQTTLASSCVVLGDAHRLQQIVWNLLSNAVKFTPGGGSVQVLLQSVDAAAVVSVRDTGIGIAPEFLPHVFDRFRQGQGGTTRLHGGLGLGLSIVRHLAEMHGGTVRASSPGAARGSEFVVRIPLATTDHREASPATSLGPALLPGGVRCPPGLRGLRVLVVDDEPDSLDVVRAILEQCEVDVNVAASASDAIACLSAEPPDVLISDIGMPAPDGFSLIRSVRTLPRAAGGDVPAVALTAYARTEDRTACLLAGFNSHVSKPVEPLELLAVVASLTRRAGQIERSR